VFRGEAIDNNQAKDVPFFDLVWGSGGLLVGLPARLKGLEPHKIAVVLMKVFLSVLLQNVEATEEGPFSV
jgi:hypothetical protein